MTIAVARRLSAALTALTALGLLVLVTAELAVRMTPLPDEGRYAARSQLVTDRDDRILWAFLADDQRWRLPATPADVDPAYLDMLLAYEDRRFRSHRGVDVLALARAAWQDLTSGRIVSGGSTITMQTVRLLEPRPRTLASKLDEALKAIRLERALSKDEILSIYLTLAPYGGNVEGVRAAALSYFGKEPADLSRSEAALLIALPQSPERLRPDRAPDAAAAAAEAVLQRLTGSPGRAPPALHAGPIARLAPHLAARLRAAEPAAPVLRTTLSGPLQEKVETIAKRAVGQWEPGVNIAVLVVRLEDMSVAAYVGGADYFDEARAGQVDLVQALRSPGSALKPFIYAMAFERLIVHPDTLISDQPVDFDGYEPENFDGGYAGDMKVRMALVRSVNTAAVALLQQVGPANLMARLRSVGAPLAIEDSDDQAGLAIALGGGGITLADLTRLYAGLGRGGLVAPLRLTPDAPERAGIPLTSPAAARAVTDILADLQPPAGFMRRTARDGGRRVAFKTGTSYGFRDAWAVGYDRLHAVGVWIGRPDGAPHLGAYGVTAAAPVMLNVFDALPTPPQDVADTGVPLGSLASPTDLPERLKRFVIRDETGKAVDLAIDFPRDNSVVSIDRGDADAAVPLTVRGGAPPYQWYVDERPWQKATAARVRWRPPGSGQFAVMVVDREGRSARTSFWVE
jgi:penicillin-binding protein 1C